MASTPEGRRAIARVAEQVLPALISRLAASELGELEVREGDWRVRLRRDPAAAGKVARTAAGPGERATGPGRSTTGERGGGSERGSSTDRGDRGDRRDRGGASRSAASRRAVNSPAVGYFTPRAGIEVGQPIRAGDVVGHVDVLGVPVDVVAPADGRLGRLYAAAGEAVEYGQELVRIDGVEASVAGAGPDGGGVVFEITAAGRAGTDDAVSDGTVDGTRPLDFESTDVETDAGIETAPALLVE